VLLTYLDCGIVRVWRWVYGGCEWRWLVGRFGKGGWVLGGTVASSDELAELVYSGSGRFGWQYSVVRDLLLW
jgi:hypothetical protein